MVNPRYIARFINGSWVVFDTIYYGNVRSARTEKDALAQAAELNQRRGGKR